METWPGWCNYAIQEIRLNWTGRYLYWDSGAMRLPTVVQKHDNIDEAESIRMIRFAVDHGLKLLDSAYLYAGGNSERLLGKALQNGYRERSRLPPNYP
jgi:predicted aldo/keto reductase-like oxidoreductase